MAEWGVGRGATGWRCCWQLSARVCADWQQLGQPFVPSALAAASHADDHDAAKDDEDNSDDDNDDDETLTASMLLAWPPYHIKVSSNVCKGMQRLHLVEHMTADWQIPDFDACHDMHA